MFSVEAAFFLRSSFKGSSDRASSYSFLIDFISLLASPRVRAISLRRLPPKKIRIKSPITNSSVAPRLLSIDRY